MDSMLASIIPAEKFSFAFINPVGADYILFNIGDTGVIY